MHFKNTKRKNNNAQKKLILIIVYFFRRLFTLKNVKTTLIKVKN